MDPAFVRLIHMQTGQHGSVRRPNTRFRVVAGSAGLNGATLNGNGRVGLNGSTTSTANPPMHAVEAAAPAAPPVILNAPSAAAAATTGAGSTAAAGSSSAGWWQALSRDASKHFGEVGAHVQRLQQELHVAQKNWKPPQLNSE